jgi:hypothetical protein
LTDKIDVSSFLARLISGSARPLKGSELAVFVKTTFPNFSPLQFGCRNLRAFIRQFASEDIVEVSHAGMDVVYGPRPVEQQALFESAPLGGAKAGHASDRRGPSQQLLTNPRIWKTFVSPGMPFRLFLVPGSGQVRVLRPEFSPDPAWLEIPRLSGDKLLQIAQSFVSELPESQRGPLAALLETPKWWIDFFETTRTFGLTTRWIAYRRRRIAEEFENALPQVPITAAAPAEEVSAPVLSAPEKQAAPANVLTEPTGSQLKKIAAEVVQRMTDSELRSLNLPLGYVLDALKTR